MKAANDLFSKANLNGAPDKVTLVIDPLIDGVTGAQSKATHLEEKRITDLVKSTYPRFEVARFSSDAVAKAPVVLIGTFTAVNNAGVAGGAKDAYRICLALADMKTKTIISKGVARALARRHRPDAGRFLQRQSGLRQGCIDRQLHQDLPGHQGR